MYSWLGMSSRASTGSGRQTGIVSRKYNTYSQEQGGPRRKILLLRNFRSRTEIVTAVNFIFGQIMSAAVGELDYTELEALNPGAVFAGNETETKLVGGETEFHLIQTEAGEEDDSPEEPWSEEGYGAEGQDIDEAVPDDAPDDEEMLEQYPVRSPAGGQTDWGTQAAR